MDPVSAAVLAAVVKLSEPAVKDAYNALKELLKRKFGAESSLASAVENLEAKPDSEGRKAVLQEEVTAAAATRDAEVLQAARDLLRRANAAGANHVEASGDRSVAVGGNVQSSTIVTGGRARIDQSAPGDSGGAPRGSA